MHTRFISTYQGTYQHAQTHNSWLPTTSPAWTTHIHTHTHTHTHTHSLSLTPSWPQALHPHELHHCYVFNHHILLHDADNFRNPLHFFPNLIQSLSPRQGIAVEAPNGEILEERKMGSIVHQDPVSHINTLLFLLPGPSAKRTRQHRAAQVSATNCSVWL